METAVHDHFGRYYTEKLWAMIPAIYRHEDGLQETPMLRAIIEVIGEQAALLRKSQDRLWEDQFIEFCDNWAIPYIGELLATRLLSAKNERGQRVDVAKTMYYRRRKGIPRVLEELINDISSWDGKLVEGFRRLARARHGLDPKPGMLGGKWTETPPGGTANLRSPLMSTLSNGPFDEYFHTPDFRKPKGLDGRYGISKLNFYLYRLVAYKVANSTPFFDGVSRYTFDPSGRSIPLFNRSKPNRQEWEIWESAFEWELPLPIRCRLLAHSEYAITEEAIQLLPLTNPEKDELRIFTGWTFPDENRLRLAVNTRPGLNLLFAAHPEHFIFLLREFIVRGCGKDLLIPDLIDVRDPLSVPKENTLTANLDNWTLSPVNRHLAIDAERGRFIFPTLPPDPDQDLQVTYYYGFSGGIGAGPYERKEVESSIPTKSITRASTQIDLSDYDATEVLQMEDSASYLITVNPLPIQDFVWQAANKQRPYIILQQNLVFTAAAHDATLILDGLWLGAKGGHQFEIVLEGDYECVVLRNCTMDPGGSNNAADQPLLPLSLKIKGKIENLCIEKCVTGPIIFDSPSLLDETLSIHDSIVQSPAFGIDAIVVNSGMLDVTRSSVFGSIKVHRLYASDILVTGDAEVLDNQSGCFRFSAAPEKSRLPHPYRAFLFKKDCNHWFTSRRFGNPGYAQLSDTAPPELQRGAENGSEMGAFSMLIDAIRADGLSIKVEEYMPFGLIPAFIHQT